MKSEKGFAQLLVILILLLGIGFGVYLTLQQTFFNPKASIPPETSYSLRTEKQDLKTNDEFEVQLLVHSDIQPANVFSAKIEFPKDALELINIIADYPDPSPSDSPSTTPGTSPTATPTPSTGSTSSPQASSGPSATPTNLPAVDLEYITSTVSCANIDGLTPDQICQKNGYTRSKPIDNTRVQNRSARGYWWRQCGGASIDCAPTSGLDCKIKRYDCTEGAGGQQPFWYDQIGQGYGNEDGYTLNPQDKIKDYSQYIQDSNASTKFYPQTYGLCTDANPGWTVRVACQRDASSNNQSQKLAQNKISQNVLGGGTGITFINTWVKKPSLVSEYESINREGVFTLTGGISSSQLHTTQSNPALMATLRFKVKSNLKEGIFIKFIPGDSTSIIGALNNTPLPLTTHNLSLNLNGYTPPSNSSSPSLTPSSTPIPATPYLTPVSGQSGTPKASNSPATQSSPSTVQPRSPQPVVVQPGTIAPPPPVKGDVNSDGKVNLTDLSVAFSYINKRTVPSKIDFNNDSKINSIDVASLIRLLQ